MFEAHLTGGISVYYAVLGLHMNCSGEKLREFYAVTYGGEDCISYLMTKPWLPQHSSQPQLYGIGVTGAVD